MKNGHMSSDSESSGAADITCGLTCIEALSCMNDPAAHNTVARTMV